MHQNHKKERKKEKKSINHEQRRCRLVERVISTAGCNDGYQAND